MILMRLLFVVLFLSVLPAPVRAQQPRFDLVLTGGRIIDPASKHREREGHAVINYGATMSHCGARGEVIRDTLPNGPAVIYRNARPDEIERIAALVRAGVDQGALGIGFGIQYLPGTGKVNSHA